MSVYVIHDEGDGFTVGIYSTFEKATRCVMDIDNNKLRRIVIYEVPLDEPVTGNLMFTYTREWRYKQKMGANYL
jgi:hypothetical protein